MVIYRLALLQVITVLLVMTGCSRSPEQLTVNRNEQAIQVTPFPPELVILEESEKNAFKIGVVHRWLAAVYSGPKDEKSIKRVLRQAYEHYREEILSLAPDATHKRIRLNIFTSRAEWRNAMLFAEVEQPAGQDLPEWPPSEVKIKSRDWPTMPSQEDGQLLIDMMDSIKAARENVESRFIDSEGILRIPSEKMISVDQEVVTAQEAAKKRLAESRGISIDDLGRNYCKWMIWSDGRPATPEAVEKMFKAMYE